MAEKKTRSDDEMKPDEPKATETIDADRLAKRAAEIANQGFNILYPDGRRRHFGGDG